MEFCVILWSFVEFVGICGNLLRRKHPINSNTFFLSSNLLVIALIQKRVLLNRLLTPS